MAPGCFRTGVNERNPVACVIPQLRMPPLVAAGLFSKACRCRAVEGRRTRLAKSPSASKTSHRHDDVPHRSAQREQTPQLVAAAYFASQVSSSCALAQPSVLHGPRHHLLRSPPARRHGRVVRQPVQHGQACTIWQWSQWQYSCTTGSPASVISMSPQGHWMVRGVDGLGMGGLGQKRPHTIDGGSRGPGSVSGDALCTPGMGAVDPSLGGRDDHQQVGARGQAGVWRLAARVPSRRVIGQGWSEGATGSERHDRCATIGPLAA
jgi:hypothetical protein